jgi:hypothetical protein
MLGQSSAASHWLPSMSNFHEIDMITDIRQSTDLLSLKEHLNSYRDGVSLITAAIPLL